MEEMNRIVKMGRDVPVYGDGEVGSGGVRVVNLVTFSELWEPCLALAI